MALGDVYEVVDVQELYDQQVLNVYYYRQGNVFVPVSGTIAQALADEWTASILPSVRAVQTGELTHVEVRVRNLFNEIDAGTALVGLPGLVAAGDTSPGFTAWGFQMQTDNASVRDGSKRIGGVSEGNMQNGVPTGGMVATLSTLANKLEAPITGGLIISNDIMFPVVVKRVKELIDGKDVYRLPANVGELVYGVIIEVLLKMLVTSQVSRKIGVGL